MGNTINTLAALGHLGHIRNSGVVSDLLQVFVSSNIIPNISIDSVNYSLQIHGYSTAITKRGNQFDLISIEQYATSHQYPMSVLLNMTNVLYHPGNTSLELCHYHKAMKFTCILLRDPIPKTKQYLSIKQCRLVFW